MFGGYVVSLHFSFCSPSDIEMDSPVMSPLYPYKDFGDWLKGLESANLQDMALPHLLRAVAGHTHKQVTT